MLSVGNGMCDMTPPVDSGEDAHALQWIDRFLDELAVDSCSSGSSSDITEDAVGSPHSLDAGLTGTALQALTHDERKRHHREAMARLRRDRRTSISRLDAQEKRLHQQLRRAMAFFERHHTPHDASAQACRCEAYVALVHEAEQLLQEQYALEHQRHAWNRYIKLVTVESERRASEMVASVGDAAADQTRSAEPPLLYVDESLETCDAAVARALQELTQARVLLSSASCDAEDCLGWQAQRRIDDRVLQCRFVRRVAGDQATVQELQRATWEMLRSPGQHYHMLGSEVEARVVQTVSADAFITRCRGSDDPDAGSARYCLVARNVPDRDRAVTLIVATLDKPALPTTAESDGGRRTPPTLGVWAVRFTCIDSESGGPGGSIEIECTAVVECETVAQASLRAVECCAALLRWELQVVPQVSRLVCA